MNDDAEVGGKENSEFGPRPDEGGVLELLELLGLIDPAVEPEEDTLTLHGHLFDIELRPFPVVTTPDEGR